MPHLNLFLETANVRMVVVACLAAACSCAPAQTSDSDGVQPLNHPSSWGPLKKLRAYFERSNAIDVPVPVAAVVPYTFPANSWCVTSGVLGVSDNGAAPRITLDARTGNIACVSVTEASSRERKQDIEPLTDALDIVRLLQGVRFRWEPALGGREDIGFIAEDVETVLPEVVHREQSGRSVIGMDYGHLSAVAIEAIKELDADVGEQQRMLELQAAEIESLKEQHVNSGDEGGIAGGAVEFFAVSGCTFHPWQNTMTFAKSSAGVNGTTSGASVQFSGAINLPNGAVVSGLEAQVLDNDATLNMTLQLVFVNTGGGAGAMATLSTTGSAGTVRTFSTNTITQGATIDNQTRAYHVNATWTVPSVSSRLRLVSVRVLYTTP